MSSRVSLAWSLVRLMGEDLARLTKDCPGLASLILLRTKTENKFDDTIVSRREGEGGSHRPLALARYLSS